MRKDRRDMRVRADAEQRDVEQGPRNLSTSRAKQRVVQASRIRCGHLAVHSMNLRRWYGHVLQQQPIGKTEVALRVAGWNFAFVAPEQMHVRPVDPVAPWTVWIGEELVEKIRRRSARQ